MARRCRSEVQNCKVSSLSSKSSKRERNAAYPSLHSENPHLPRRALPPSLAGLGKTLDYCPWLAPSQIRLLVPSVKRAVASRGKICATLTPVLSAVKEPPVRLDLDWGLLRARAGKRYRGCKTIRSAETVLRGWRSCTLMRPLKVNLYPALCPNDDALSTEILPELWKLTRPDYARF